MATIRAQLVRWGNSLAVRIPKTVLDQASLREGEELDIGVEEGRISIQPARRRLTLKSLIAGITPDNVHGEQDWGKPAGKEPW
jgi:antitoxin MazE